MLDYKGFYLWHNPISNAWIVQQGYTVLHTAKNLAQAKRWVTKYIKKGNQKMKPTPLEKKRLRNYWQMPLRFRSNGTVEAKKGECWGLLLTASQLDETLKLWRS